MLSRNRKRISQNSWKILSLDLFLLFFKSNKLPKYQKKMTEEIIWNLKHLVIDTTGQLIHRSKNKSARWSKFPCKSPAFVFFPNGSSLTSSGALKPKRSCQLAEHTKQWRHLDSHSSTGIVCAKTCVSKNKFHSLRETEGKTMLKIHFQGCLAGSVDRTCDS